MKIHDLLLENLESQNFVEIFQKFLPLAMKHIGISSLPRMKFLTSISNPEQPTFGRYANKENTLYIALNNRHPNDILRTVAHELQHYKQDLDNRLNGSSGETGSSEENEANAVAGIVMRHFNQEYPEYLTMKPLMLEKWSLKYKRSINCSNPKGFSQRAHCQGRKKQEGIDAATRLDRSLRRSGINLADREKYYSDTSQRLQKQELEYKRQGIIDVDKNDIHRLADQKNIKWDNDPRFLELSNKLTGTTHLDDMNRRQLQKLFNYLYDL